MAVALPSSVAFVPALQGQTSPPSSLRGAPQVQPGEQNGTLGGLTLTAGAVLTCGAVAASSKRRRGIARRAATSYKDFKDPWLSFADWGFDPLNVAVGTGVFDKSKTSQPQTVYYNYRESEVKHGRFAMVAFLAIFAESADRSAVLKQLGAVNAVDSLDGTLGLDEVQLPVLLIGLGYQALAEYNLQRAEDDGTFLAVEYKEDRCPGDLGFDPLGLGKGPGANVVGLHNTEVWSGRLAMIGITSFLVKEFVIKDPEIASKIL